jgi:hypothetical protein
MQEVYVYVGTLGSDISMERKIFGYKAADKRAGRAWVEEEYITPADIKGMLCAQSGRCVECGCVLQQQWFKGDHEQLTVDRKDSDKAHVRHNCQLLCLKCNKSKRGERVPRENNTVL